MDQESIETNRNQPKPTDTHRDQLGRGERQRLDRDEVAGSDLAARTVRLSAVRLGVGAELLQPRVVACGGQGIDAPASRGWNVGLLRARRSGHGPAARRGAAERGAEGGDAATGGGGWGVNRAAGEGAGGAGRQQRKRSNGSERIVGCSAGRRRPGVLIRVRPY
eukprot:SAG31_NODE_2_length_46263_cov_45.908043_14_plen_164_part_00